jgi:hypothetical protein
MGPMAIAMMGGLVAATILTMTFLPALYAFAFRVLVPEGSDSPLVLQPHAVMPGFAAAFAEAGE